MTRRAWLFLCCFGAILVATILYLALRDTAQINNDLARQVLDGCLSGTERHCYYKGRMNHSHVVSHTFRREPIERRVSNSVSYFKFRSNDDFACAYVEFVKTGSGFDYGADLYECRQEGELHLGTG